MLQVVAHLPPNLTLRSFLEALKGDVQHEPAPLRFQAVATDGGVDTSCAQMVYLVRLHAFDICCAFTYAVYSLHFDELVVPRCCVDEHHVAPVHFPMLSFFHVFCMIAQPF